MTSGGSRRTPSSTPTTGRKRSPRLKAAERRVQLLGVARAVFAERGFAAASVEEIAGRAGVSKPVVYEHFGGKDEVYDVVVRAELADLVGRIKSSVRLGEPRVSVTGAVRAFLIYIDEEPEGFAILVHDAPIGRRSAAGSPLDDVARAVQKLLAGELDARGYDAKMAPVLSRSLVGMVAMPGRWWVSTRRPRRDEVAGRIADLAWNGLSRLDGRRGRRARR